MSMSTDRERIDTAEIPDPAGIGTVRRVATAAELARAAPGPDAESDTRARHTHPLTDRRCASRVKHKFVTQMTPWEPGRPPVPFDVIIDDISETGIGLIHHQPIELGLRHLLTVPRAQGKPVTREYVIARCDRRPDGHYAIGLQVENDLPTPPGALDDGG
jgi:hypothetical protein